MMKILEIKILAFSLIVLFSGFKLSAQMIPQSYFEPKAGGTPKSDFYTLISYGIGYVSEADEIEFNGVGYEGLNVKFFFPASNKKGYAINVNYSKAIQYATLTGYQEIGISDSWKPILSSNFELKLKSISNKQWAFGLVYQLRQYKAGYAVKTISDETYLSNGIGFETSVGGYPNLDYKKGNWPVSFKTGLLLQIESFDKPEPGLLAYGELALERIRKKQGVSFYASLFLRAEVESYNLIPEWAEVDDFGDSITYIYFDGLYLIPGFRFGLIF